MNAKFHALCSGRSAPLACAIMLAVCSSHARAQCAPTTLSHLGGSAQQVVVRGNIGYVVYGGELRSVNLANINAPVNLGSLFLPGVALEVALNGNQLYAAMGVNGLVIVDISAPSAPAILATVDIMAEDVAISNGKAFVASDGDLIVVDVTNPAAPFVASTFDPLSALVTHVSSSGNTVYLGTFADVISVDATNAAAPVEIDRLALGESVQEMALVGSSLFVGTSGGGRIVNITNPAALSLSSILGSDYVFNMTANSDAGQVLFYIDTTNGISVYDATVPTAPALLTIIDGDSFPEDLDGAGPYLFEANRDGHLVARDLTVRTAPVLISETIRQPNHARRAAAVGTTLLVESGGLQIIDASAPLSPTIAATSVLSPSGTVVSGTIAYWHRNLALEVVDVSNPLVPVVLSTLAPLSPSYLELDGTDLCAMAYAEFFAYDVTDPLNPVQTVRIGPPTFMAAGELAVGGGYAYVSAPLGGGVTVIDLHAAGGPAIVREYPPVASSANKLALREGVLAVSNLGQLVSLIDVSDPLDAHAIGSFVADVAVTALQFEGTLLIISDADGEITYLDTADPAAPFAVGRAQIGGAADDLVVIGTTVWCIGYDSGLWGVDLPNYVRLSDLPADAVVCAGSPDASFSVTVSSPGLRTFRWRKGAALLSNGPTATGAIISGAFSPTLTITGALPGDLGEYSCIVATSCGGTITAPATLSGALPTTIFPQPQDQVSCPTGSVTFAVTGLGTPPFTYQWQRETPPGSGTFVDVLDGNTPNLTISGSATRVLTIAARPGQTIPPGAATAYRCVVGGTCGSDTSDPASLIVCVADFDCSGQLDPDDLSDFITCFFLEVQFPGTCAEAEFNGDGFINPDDLSDFITFFFLGC